MIWMYLKFLLIIVILFVVYGFVGPFLISAGSDELVMLGFAVVWLSPIACVAIFLNALLHIPKIKTWWIKYSKNFKSNRRTR